MWSAGADPALLQLANLVAKPAFVFYANQLGLVPGEEVTTYNLLAIPGKKGAMEVRAPRGGLGGRVGGASACTAGGEQGGRQLGKAARHQHQSVTREAAGRTG